MRKKSKNLIVILIIIVILAVGAWLLFFKADSTENDTNTNQTNQEEDLGLDSVVDTSALSDIDIESDLDNVDYYANDHDIPDINLNVQFE
ncbi:hypothetical protein KKG41_02995 [Patescibacteria group bacterium]|nr:hypothetical protein [Patescibacteria group bacterium]MBU1891116.1 hypothetical protein [Patescibacteria group bacterium]